MSWGYIVHVAVCVAVWTASVSLLFVEQKLEIYWPLEEQNLQIKHRRQGSPVMVG